MQEYKVTAYCLNIRQKPSLSGRVTAYLRKNDRVTVLDKSENNYWFRIKEPVGWVSHKFLAPVSRPGIKKGDDPLWLLIAINEIGVAEYSGYADNPRIIEYHRTTTLGPRYANQDETPWCSSFVNWCMERAGYEGTDSAAARSWLRWGVELDKCRRGCVVILKRPPNPVSGHVGFYMDETSETIRILGGNQGDKVSIQNFRKDRLIGYRWPGV